MFRNEALNGATAHRPSNACLASLASLAFTFLAAHAQAMSLTVAYETPGSLIMPDLAAHVLRRSDTGGALPVPFWDGSTAAPSARLYFIPTNATGAGGFAVADIRVRFRLSDLPLACQTGSAPTTGSIFASGAPPASNRPAITAYQIGTGNGDFVEFVLDMPAYPLTHFGDTRYFDFSGAYPGFNCIWRTRLDMLFLTPYAIEDYVPAGVDRSPVDHWFRLSHFKWPDAFVDNMPMPEAIMLHSEPLAGESVTISATNLVFKPSTAVTDSDGLFGVVAFVEQAAFEAAAPTAPGAGPDAKGAPAKAGTSRGGSLTVKYRDVMRAQGISGNFAEVIQLEGRVTIVGSSGAGTVSVGDFLLPGTTLSLSAQIGEKPAQLGLRFVNGSEAQVTQDVFTNACITDLITIGSNGFTDKSVIQGKTALMSLSRYLCEWVAGLPNTPDEWALATGKFVVKQAVSAVVPVSMGYETTAFIVKYAVSTGAGQVYDQTLSSPGNNGSKSATPKAAGSDRRLEISTYYDGSVRIAENIAGDFAIFAGAASAPFAATQDGRWQEFTGAAVAGRAWNESPDSLDVTGPVLNMAHAYFAPLGSTSFRLAASDPSGLDTASLSVLIDGVAGDMAGSFRYQGGGVWVGDLLGLSPYGARLQVSLADRLGRRTLLEWRGDQIPRPPVRLAAFHTAGRTWVEWEPPTGMAPATLQRYEMRQLRMFGADYLADPWRSVGTATRMLVELPAGLAPGGLYAVEVRAWNATGMAGDSARSVQMTAEEITARLDVSRAGAGAGIVAGEGIACGTDCTAFLLPGSGVSLTAVPATGSAFSGWSGACTGTGTCELSMNAARSVTATFVPTVTPPRLANISTRMQVQTGDNVLIGGFIIGGSQPKMVVVRARGPSLAPFGIAQFLANPVLQLYAGQAVIAANDDWGNATNAAVVSASGYAPADALESAILTTLAPGAYTAIVTGAGGTTGVGIVEVFELDKPDMPLANIATRGQVLAGNDVMIGGFIIQGDGPQSVVVRARGPSLAPFGIANFLANPVLQLFSGQTVIESNDDWGQATNAAQISSSGFAPAHASESAILVTLNPGAYTAIVTGKNGGTGVGIVEVFAQK